MTFVRFFIFSFIETSVFEKHVLFRTDCVTADI